MIHAPSSVRRRPCGYLFIFTKSQETHTRAGRPTRDVCPSRTQTHTLAHARTRSTAQREPNSQRLCVCVCVLFPFVLEEHTGTGCVSVCVCTCVRKCSGRKKNNPKDCPSLRTIRMARSSPQMVDGVVNSLYSRSRVSWYKT